MNPFVFAVKRSIGRPLYGLLLVLCSAAIVLAGTVSDGARMPSAGAYVPRDSAESGRIAAYLLENGFVRYEDPEEMEKLVQRGALDCAVIFPEDLVQRMEEGRLAGCVQWIVSPSSFVPDLYKSHVAAVMFRQYAPYLAARSFEGTGISRVEVLREYEMMFEEGYAFSFEILMAEEGRAPMDFRRRSLVLGAASVLLCAAMFSFCAELMDASFHNMLGRVGFRRAMAGIALPGVLARAILAACAGCLGLLLIQMYELMIPLVIYVFLLAGTGIILAAVMPGVWHLYVLISVLTICSVALCPIYTDLALVFPVLAVVRLVLPTYWLWLVPEAPALSAATVIAAWLGGIFLLELRYIKLKKYRFRDSGALKGRE